MGSASFDDLRYVDAIISRDVLVPNAPRDAEAKSWMGEREVAVPGLERALEGSEPWRREKQQDDCELNGLPELPLGPLMSLISMTFSAGGFRRMT